MSIYQVLFLRNKMEVCFLRDVGRKLWQLPQLEDSSIQGKSLSTIGLILGLMESANPVTIAQPDFLVTEVCASQIITKMITTLIIDLELLPGFLPRMSKESLRWVKMEEISLRPEEGFDYHLHDLEVIRSFLKRQAGCI